MESRFIQVYRKDFSRILDTNIEIHLKQAEIASAKTVSPSLDRQVFQGSSLVIVAETGLFG